MSEFLSVLQRVELMKLIFWVLFIIFVIISVFLLIYIYYLLSKSYNKLFLMNIL